MQRVFSLAQTPFDERGEKSCMEFGFLAVLMDQDQRIGIPFWCTDYYGRSVLLFSGDAPPRATIDRIAAAFWNILLADPQDLPDYTDRFAHVGGGFDVCFGVRDGEPFMEEIVE